MSIDNQYDMIMHKYAYTKYKYVGLSLKIKYFILKMVRLAKKSIWNSTLETSDKREISQGNSKRNFRKPVTNEI